MPKTFQLKIAAADRLYYDGPCHSLVLPCLDGELGVLAGHEPATIALDAGELRYTLDGVVQVVAVGEGYAQVGTEGTVVLVGFAEDPTDIDEERVRRENEITRERVKLRQSEQEYIRLRADLSRQMAELKVLKHRHKT